MINRLRDVRGKIGCGDQEIDFDRTDQVKFDKWY